MDGDMLNPVNDGQEETVDFQENESADLPNEPEEGNPEDSVANESIDKGDKPQEDLSNGGLKEAAQQRDFEKDRMFAQVRKNAQRYGREQAESDYKPLLDALKNYGYSGSPRDMADMIAANDAGLSIDEYREKQRQTEAEIRNHPLFKAMEDRAKAFEERNREIESQRVYSDDLKRIKEAFPDMTVKDVDDLGEQFFKLRGDGVSPTVAYKAVMEEKRRKSPPVIGAVNSGTKAAKSFYSSDEVDEICANHPELLDDPVVYATIKKSQSQW